jgi:filamentous hemagglutinin
MQLLVVEARAQGTATLPMTPDRSGPSRPVIGVSASGVPLVNITAPNAAGVSMNRFTQYNVGTKGAVIVNSGRNTQSQLAGWVQGNPFLGNNAARVIVNQVTSGHPTQLLGPTEIAGRHANLVIANPAGISCAGCGFINAPRVSLSTGLPTFASGGALAGFDVTRGHVGVAGDGLDARGSAIDLIARAMTINGDVWAQSIDATAGANRVDYRTNAAHAQAGDASAPAVAIDVAALGGMYANSIRLVGTEAGVGVRDAGMLTSLTGDIRVSSDGDVTIEPGARLQSAADMRIDGANVAQRGTLSSARAIDLNVRGTLSNDGALAAGGDVMLNAATSFDNGGRVFAGADAGGRLTGDGALAVRTARIASGGTLAAGGRVSLAADGIALDRGTVQAGEAVEVVADGALSNAGGTIDGRDVTLRGGVLVNDGGQIGARGVVDLAARSVSNRDGVLSAGALSLNAAGALDNTRGRIGAARGMQLAAADVMNVDGRIGSTAEVLRLSATGAISNVGGRIVSGDGLTLSAQSLDNRRGQIGTTERAAGGTALSIARDLVNAGGTIASAGALTVGATHLDNRAGEIAARDASIVATDVTNTDGRIGTANALAVDASGQLSNRLGAIVGGTRFVLTAGGIDNASGRLGTTSGDMRVSAARAFANADGTLGSAGRLTLDAGTLDNTNGRVTSVRAARVDAGDIVNAGGQIGALQDSLALTATGNVSNAGGKLVAASGLSIVADAFDNTGGQLGTRGAGANAGAGGAAAGGDTVLKVARGFDNTRGTISSTDALTLDVGALDNTRGRMSAAAIAIDASGALTNTEGTIAAQRDVALRMQTASNRHGTIGSVDGTLSLATRGITDNRDGKLLARGDAALVNDGLVNAAGTVSGANVALESGSASIDNARGTIAAAQLLTSRSGAFDNRSGVVQAGGETDIDTHGRAFDNGMLAGRTDGGQVLGHGVALRTGELNNATGVVSSSGATTIDAASLINDAGSIVSNDALAIRSAGVVSNVAGQIGGNGDVAIDGVSVDNTRGAMHASGALSVGADTIRNAHTATATLLATAGVPGMVAGLEGASVALNARQRIDNTDGAIRADRDASLSARTIDNRSGRIHARRDATLNAADTLVNDDGDVNGGAHVTVSAGRLDNGGTLQSSGDVVVTTHGDLRNRGRIVAGRDLSATAGGVLDNAGMLSAGGTANVAADAIDNRASGEIFGNGAANVRANRRVVNEGLIDGGATTITAGDTIENAGRIYGDTVALGARAVTNGRNAQGVGGVIASRSDLDIGAGAVTNRGDALIHASNDIRVGGALDGDRRATGAADVVTNEGAQIDAGRDIAIKTNRFENLNADFRTEKRTVDVGRRIGYRLRGSTEEIDASDVYLYQKNNHAIVPGTEYAWGLDDDDQKRLLLPSDRYPAGRYGRFTFNGTAGFIEQSVKRPPGTVSSTGQPYPEIFRSADPALWEIFGLTPPPEPWPGALVDAPPMRRLIGEPIAPKGWLALEVPTDEDMGEKLRIGQKPTSCVESAAAVCAPINEKIAQWRSAHQALNMAIGTYNADVNAHLVDKWSVVAVDLKSTRDVVTESRPGIVTAGRRIAIDAASGVNDKSRIVAGDGNHPTNVRNVGAEGVETVTGSGSMWDTWVESGGFGKGDKRASRRADFAPAIPPKTIDLSIVMQDPAKPAGPVKQVAADVAAAQGTRGSDVTAVAGRSVDGGIDAGGRVDHVQAGAIASVSANVGGVVVRTVEPDTRLPNNALYRVANDSGRRFVVETDPRFADYRTWLSSDTMLAALKVDPGTVLRRIGDGFYEQQLIQQQVIRATGQRFVGDYTDNESQYRALIANGVGAAKRFGLNVGTALTDAQMAALTSDIVWLVERTVTLADGGRQTVLVPQVYLRANAADVTGDGTIIAGRDVTIDANGAYENSGTIASRNVTVIRADSIENRGTIAGGSVQASAQQDLKNLGGLIQGNSVALSAGRDLSLTSTTSAARTANGETTVIDRVSAINAGAFSALAGRDLNANAAVIATTGGAVLAASRDVDLNAVRQSSRDTVKWDDRNRSERAISVDTGTQIVTGGHLAIAAGRDVNATAAYVSAAGVIGVSAGRDVNLDAGEQSASAYDERARKERGVLSSKSTHTIDSSGYTNAVGTTLSGDSVTVVAARDLTAKAATVAGSGDVNLVAGRDLSIGTAETASSEYHFEDVKKSGLGGAGAGVSYGTSRTTDTRRDTMRGAEGSLIGSTGGNVSMRARNKLHITGSDIVAAGNVTGVAKNVTIDASQTNRHHDETHETKSTGFTLAVKSPVVDAVQNVNQQAQGAGRSQDGRAAALHAIAAAGGALDAAGAVGKVAGALKQGQMPDAKVELSFGSSRSKTTFTESSTQNNGSSVKAGGEARFVATGDKAAGQGNLTIQGSSVTAKDVMLEATNRVDLVNSTDRVGTRSTNESKSSSLGVSVGTGGVGVSAAMSRAHGDGNSDAATQNNTRIGASGTVKIVSGGDTNVVGANVSGKKIVADVGGNLNVASVQDTSQSTARQSSVGGGLSAGMSGGSANVSMQKGSASGSYAGVNEQSGIRAGDGGFDITVKGNTDLKGAYIASDATPDKNRLTTGTMSFDDMRNRSEYSASSAGLSAGGGIGDGGANGKTHGVDSQKSSQGGKQGTGSGQGTNPGGVLPTFVGESGGDSALTRSAVSEGTITITDRANQKQDLAMLTRDTTNLNGTVSQTPDLQNALGKQSDLMSAAQAAAETVAKQIGAFADKKADAAHKAAENETDLALKAEYLQEAKNWSEGGDSRTAMHAAGGALTGGLTAGGLGSVGGALGAGLSAKLAPELSEVARAIRDAGPTGNENVDALLGNLAANVLAGGAGAVVGGVSGAMTGAATERFNRQLHPDERASIERRKESYAKQNGLTVALAEQELLSQANLMVQNGSPGQWNERAAEFLRQERGMLPADGNGGPGYMFYATPEQKANAGLYAKYYPGGVGMNVPSDQAVASSATREQAYRDAYTKGTIGAAAGAATIAVGGPIGALPGTPIFSPGGAFGSGALASPVGTGTISAGITAGSQYVQNGQINPVEVAGAFVTGAAGAYRGLLWNIGVNTIGGATTTALDNLLQGKSGSVVGAAITSGALSGLGYGIGKVSESGVNAILRPGINARDWASTGAWSGGGWNLFNPNNLAPIGGAVGGGAGQELINGMYQKIQSKNGAKK